MISRGFIQRHGRSLAAIAIVSTAYGFARAPELPPLERRALAARFRFVRAPLPSLPGAVFRSVRDVNPSLEHLSAWISSVGAAVALDDLDGDGLPNDVVYVDPRTDQVIVCPAPGTPARYAAFALDPSPLPYDRATMAPMGCLPGDYNEDGVEDLLVYYWGRTPVVFLARGRGRPARERYVASEIASRPERWYTNAATRADLDGDGHVDLVFGNYFSESERILDAKARLPDHMQHSMSRAFNGGRNRLLLWTPAGPSRAASEEYAVAASGPDRSPGRSPAPRPVRFQEVNGAWSDAVGHGWTLAVGAQDLDGDLLPELYFANDFGPDRLLYNRSTPGHLKFDLLHGIKHFTTPNSKVLGRDSFKGMGVDFGDLNGDGVPDIYVSNITAEYALEESHFTWMSTGTPALMRAGVAPYDDRSEPMGLSRSGWAWESRLDDLDNDGVLEALQATGFIKGTAGRWPQLQELAIGNDDLLEHPGVWPRFRPGDDLCGHQRNAFFVRGPDGRYVDLAGDIAGLDNREVSRGIATADVDGDGDLDFAVANQWETSYLYMNESPGHNAFLGLDLLLPPAGTHEPFLERGGHPGPDTPGSPAIGATAHVRLPDGRHFTAQVDGGNGHSGKRSPELHFGLGPIAAHTALAVDLAWRDRAGSVQRRALTIAPGWHTIMLGEAPAGAAR